MSVQFADGDDCGDVVVLWIHLEWPADAAGTLNKLDHENMPVFANTSMPERKDVRLIWAVLSVTYVPVCIWAIVDDPRLLLPSIVAVVGSIAARIPGGLLGRYLGRRVGYHAAAWFCGVVGGALALSLFQNSSFNARFSTDFWAGTWPTSLSFGILSAMFVELIVMPVMSILGVVVLVKYCLRMVMSDASKPQRRWYQFSLQSLLIVVTVFTVSVGWVASRMHRAQVNRRRLAAVEEALAPIVHIRNGRWVDVEGINPQSWLEKQLDDPGNPLEFHITLSGASVTDASLERLNGLADIHSLWLIDSNVSDAGLKHLEGLANLRSLALWHTSISDAGLEHLKGLTGLQSLWLVGTNVSDVGVDNLRRALPNCKITNQIH